MSSEDLSYSFATIDQIYDDGITLIFDGEETASEKHYKCNSFCIFAPGQRVRIIKDSGTYVVEYPVGNPNADAILPAGGTDGQVLTKDGNEGIASKWADMKGIPTGGTKGQLLSKRTNEPCRHPELAMPSLETYGINVSELAASSGMKYINGQNTVTYFGALLFCEA